MSKNEKLVVVTRNAEREFEKAITFLKSAHENLKYVEKECSDDNYGDMEDLMDQLYEPLLVLEHNMSIVEETMRSVRITEEDK